MTVESTKDIKEEIEYQALSEFLEGNPPNQVTAINDLADIGSYTNGNRWARMRTPQLQLHCSHESCNGIRFFRCISDGSSILNENDYDFFYLTYKCSNCQETEKTFSLAAKLKGNVTQEGDCYKFGELPTFGPSVSPKLIKLIGPDRDDFLKGRRCENQGLGVGAFIYYRRVVENQKDRILGKIITVSEKIGASEESIDRLRNAISETQFSKAMDVAKSSLPESLLISGHNPLALLHSALSEGVHAMNDEECLTIAGSVRVVLGELADRLSQALKDEAEVKRALSHLMNRKKS